MSTLLQERQRLITAPKLRDRIADLRPRGPRPGTSRRSPFPIAR